MRTVVLVCSLTVAAALLLRGTAPERPPQTAIVTSLIAPASMYVDERVAIRASVINDSGSEVTRTFHLCLAAAAECVRTSRGDLPSHEAWTGFAGSVTPREVGAYYVELVVHEDWGVDSSRATARVAKPIVAIEMGE